MWTFKISNGTLYHDGVVIGSAYSGAPGDVDNPADENVADHGPIPEGWYTIGTEQETPTPVALPLTPDSTNTEYGRSDFLIHGDSIKQPGTASHGCIITARAIRETIRDSGDNRLQVTA